MQHPVTEYTKNTPSSEHHNLRIWLLERTVIKNLINSYTLGTSCREEWHFLKIYWFCFLISLTMWERYKQFTFWWSDRTIWGKLANWKSTKKMSWLERCCHRSWLVPPSSNFSSVSDRSMAYTTRSTSWSSSTGQRCLCCKAEIRYSIPKALPLALELAQLQLQYSILTEGWEAWDEVWT